MCVCVCCCVCVYQSVWQYVYISVCIYISACLCVQPCMLQTLRCGRSALRLQLQHGQQEVTELSRLVQRPLVFLQQDLEQTPRLQTGDVTQLTWDRYREVKRVVRGETSTERWDRWWWTRESQQQVAGGHINRSRGINYESQGVLHSQTTNHRAAHCAVSTKCNFWLQLASQLQVSAQWQQQLNCSTGYCSITQSWAEFSNSLQKYLKWKQTHRQPVSPLLLKYSLEYLPDRAKGRGIGPSSSMMWAMWSENRVKIHTEVISNTQKYCLSWVVMPSVMHQCSTTILQECVCSVMYIIMCSTFISGIIFPWVRLKQVISCRQLKCLKHQSVHQ